MSSILTDNIDDTNKPYRVIVMLSNKPILFSFGHHLSVIAQLIEHLTINHRFTLKDFAMLLDVLSK